MAKTRICFVGGGSYQWTPKLLTDIALTKDLSGTIVLHDIAEAPILEMQKLGKKIMRVGLTSPSRPAATSPRPCATLSL